MTQICVDRVFKLRVSIFILQRTDIPCKEMLINLSSWPNVNRDWLRRLRINYEGLGDVASVKACVRQEMLASRGAP